MPIRTWDISVLFFVFFANVEFGIKNLYYTKPQHRVAFPYFRAWKHSCLALQVSSLHWCYFTLIFTPPEQFAPHFHLEAGFSKCLFLSVNYTQYHFLKVNSPHSSPLTLQCLETPLHVRSLHAYTLVFFIYPYAEQTHCCVSVVSSVMMMKGTCCSQQKALSTLHNQHPACIIHKSSGNSVTA